MLQYNLKSISKWHKCIQSIKNYKQKYSVAESVSFSSTSLQKLISLNADFLLSSVDRKQRWSNTRKNISVCSIVSLFNSAISFPSLMMHTVMHLCDNICNLQTQQQTHYQNDEDQCLNSW